MKLVVLGLSLSSSWGNGHATTYRALLRAFAARGHDILFLERNVPWYAAQRDLTDPDFCRWHLYDNLLGLDAWRHEIARADAVVVGSYVPDGIAVGDWVRRQRTGVTAFYDIDTPVTLAAVRDGACGYLAASQIAAYDLYLSFTGGPILDVLQRDYRSPRARALYCSVDPDRYRPGDGPTEWDLSYLGTYSEDRQPTLERLLLAPARRAPECRFVVAGPQYPDGIDWPDNVHRLDHVAPADHPAFYGASRFTLNVTRAAMVAAGHSPSVRLFEAAACGTAIITDRWAGLDSVFGRAAMAVADSPDDVVRRLRAADSGRLALGRRARAVVAQRHTAGHRAAELETFLGEAIAESRSRLQATPPRNLAYALP